MHIKRMIVYISLLLQIIFGVFSGLLFPNLLPPAVMLILFIFANYGAWLIQIFIGRKYGLSSGISGALFFAAGFWNSWSNLRGYEVMMIPPIILFYIPIALVIIGVIIMIFDFVRSFKVTEENAVTISKKDQSAYVLASFTPIFAYFAGKAPKMTLAYVDQGIPINFAQPGFLIFLTIPLVLMFIFSAISIVQIFNISESLSRKIAIILLIIFLIVFIVTLLVMPFLFLFGINSFIFLGIMISTMLLTPFIKK